MLKYDNIVDLYSQADNFYLLFNEDKAKEKIKEIEDRGKIAIKVKVRDKITIFEIKKII